VTQGINSSGVTAGYYTDHTNIYHGFVRAANGIITSFDSPDAGHSSGNGTIPAAISDSCGIVTGYSNNNSSSFGSSFVRYPDNTIGTFGAVSGQVTIAYSITSPACGTIIAGSIRVQSSADHGFVRAADGTITNFDAPGAGTQPNQGTVPRSLNSAGVIAGYYIDLSGVDHGFVRAGGTNIITSFDAPGAGTQPNQGTFPVAVNSSGVITGFYVDSSGAYHGFVRKP
jgi:hypothetical protein